MLYNWNDNKLMFGKGRPNDFSGKEIKFHSEDREYIAAKYIFVGHLEKFKFHKNGFFVDKN